jgi:hypothetical protein
MQVKVYMLRFVWRDFDNMSCAYGPITPALVRLTRWVRFIGQSLEGASRTTWAPFYGLQRRTLTSRRRFMGARDRPPLH